MALQIDAVQRQVSVLVPHHLKPKTVVEGQLSTKWSAVRLNNKNEGRPLSPPPARRKEGRCLHIQIFDIEAPFPCITTNFLETGIGINA